MNAALDRLVRSRASRRCEYCQLPQAVHRAEFEIDHIIARKHGGATHAENLALACYSCNSYKGANIAGIDPDSGAVTRLFHPRTDSWDAHFSWAGALLVGRTPVGRTTIAVLVINHPDHVTLRQELIAEGYTPE